jgi:hypothetical protein
LDKRGPLLRTASCVFVKRKPDGLTAETPPNRTPKKAPESLFRTGIRKTTGKSHKEGK